MVRIVIAVILTTACSFDGSTDVVGLRDDADPNQPDAPPADALASCTPSEKLCVDNVLETCLANGMGLDPGLAEPCSFACVNNICVSASNLSSVEVEQCDGQSLPLTPVATATLRVVNNGGTPEIQCSPDCGDGTTAIAAQSIINNAGSPDLAKFCLSLLDIPVGASLEVDADLPWALALVVQATAVVAGTINISAGDALVTGPGAAGPGGGLGAALHNGDGIVNGEGACPGVGGTRAGTQADRIGGGGGGGGFGGTGGSGGQGQSGGGAIATGGAGAGLCGGETLIPLFAGSGGGGGADGAVGVTGWAGGSGAGALQISSRISLNMNGSIIAIGGLGYSDLATFPTAPGSGAGSGGGVLLEAPVLTFTGDVVVDGASGADGSAGSGGTGGAGANASGGNGADQSGSRQSGGGGGGGGGRVRVNAAVAPICQNVSPASACTSGTMQP